MWVLCVSVSRPNRGGLMGYGDGAESWVYFHLDLTEVNL